jgi:starch phosphorylase
MMKASMKKLSPRFSTHRMVAEYVERFYIPAGARYRRLEENGAARVRPLVEWRKRIHNYGRQVRVSAVDPGGSGEALAGSKFKVGARVYLGELSPAEVRVQIYWGRLDENGGIIDGVPVDMSHRGVEAGEHLYEGEVECTESGSCGFSVRVLPFHEDAILPYEMPWITWAE